MRIEKYQHESIQLVWFEYRQVISIAQSHQDNKIRKQIDSLNNIYRKYGKRRNHIK